MCASTASPLSSPAIGQDPLVALALEPVEALPVLWQSSRANTVRADWHLQRGRDPGMPSHLRSAVARATVGSSPRISAPRRRLRHAARSDQSGIGRQNSRSITAGSFRQVVVDPARSDRSGSDQGERRERLGGSSAATWATVPPTPIPTEAPVCHRGPVRALRRQLRGRAGCSRSLGVDRGRRPESRQAHRGWPRWPGPQLGPAAGRPPAIGQRATDRRAPRARRLASRRSRSAASDRSGVSFGSDVGVMASLGGQPTRPRRTPPALRGASDSSR